MAYTPPTYNAVNVDFTKTGYTPPAYNAVNVDFGAVAKTGNRKPRPWQKGSARGNSFKRP